MEGLKIMDVTLENLDDLIYLCIPPDRRRDPPFVRGAEMKRRWAAQAIEKYGSIAKLAYLDSKPVGLIQYQLNPKERVVEISCIFVPDEKNHKKGIGRSLLKTLIEDVKNMKVSSDNDSFLALVTWAFEVPSFYPQHKFYQKMGFKRVKRDNPYWLYFPLRRGYVYTAAEERFIPQKEDKGKALIFYDPSCPFCIYFAERIEESIKEVAPDIPVRLINMFEEPEEVKKRGKVPYCVVNGKPIGTFFEDKEKFQNEVTEALGDSAVPS
jgi:GNAT superfamily N-acetyltransferase/glutaredoxin